jgi:hypothetical protein
MAAYRAKRWILTTLESIRGQETRDGWTYSLRIGVDGCEETSSLLLAEGEPHWYSTTNVGPYVMRNSLIELEPAEAYAIFDADDVMLPEYLATLLGWSDGGKGIAGASMYRIDEDGVRIPGRHRYSWGVSLIRHQAWTKLGGFRDWRVAADSDLIRRARALRTKVRAGPEPLFERRVVAGSLTRAAETGMESELRRKLREASQSATLARQLRIEPVTTPLEWREP